MSNHFETLDSRKLLSTTTGGDVPVVDDGSAITIDIVGAADSNAGSDDTGFGFGFKPFGFKPFGGVGIDPFSLVNVDFDFGGGLDLSDLTPLILDPIDTDSLSFSGVGGLSGSVFADSGNNSASGSFSVFGSGGFSGSIVATAGPNGSSVSGSLSAWA
jgi:hypothetical protein